MHYDVAIIGAGIAGASVAAELSPFRSVIMFEAEAQPGYHSTGRSNAFWQATYGGPGVAPLTNASRHALEIGGYLGDRGGLTISNGLDERAVEAFEARFIGSDIALQRTSDSHLQAVVPGLRPEWRHGVYEPDCFDIDVAGLHSLYLGTAKRKDVDLVTQARVSQIARAGGRWQLQVGTDHVEADILVNAAGAWADKVAEDAGVRPLGITPYRRTISQLRLGIEVSPSLPLIMDIEGAFYFRPEGKNRIWLSPHDETPSLACDAAPEEIDVAVAIDQFQKVVDWPIAVVEHSWAGLRSFAPDRLPVYGFDRDIPSFFWCAGQGGFGIQTAPAAAKLCSALVTGNDADAMISGVNPRIYAPNRFG